MSYEFTNHAVRRMQRRRLTERDVVRVIEGPRDRRELPDKIEYYGRVRRRPVVVVVSRFHPRVITVYFTDE